MKPSASVGSLLTSLCKQTLHLTATKRNIFRWKTYHLTAKDVKLENI